MLYSVKKYYNFKTVKNIKPLKIIGKPIPVGSFEVTQFDLPNDLEWNDANTMCDYFGEDWRLPTKDELHFMYKNKEVIGSFINGDYWSSTTEGYSNHEFDIWCENFKDGKQYLGGSGKCCTRLVRTITEYNNPNHLVKKKFT